MKPHRYLFSLTRRQADIIEWALKYSTIKSDLRAKHFPNDDTFKNEKKTTLAALKLFQSKRDQFKNLHTRGRKKK